MNFEYSPYILPLVAAAAISIFVAIYAWRHLSSAGAPALAVLAIAIGEWGVGYALEISSTGLNTMYVWAASQYLGIAFAPYAWFIFAMDFSGYSKTLTRRFLLLMAVVPFLTVLLAWTTKWHGLIWTGYQISPADGFSALSTEKGIWFWVHTAYSYLMLLTGTVLLLRILWRRQGLYRGQVAAMLIAVLAPWVGNVLYLSGNSPIPYLDITPFAFTITVAALAWAVFGFHLVDVTPIARDLVVDSLLEGVLVLDARGRVADVNSSAARIFGVEISQVIGNPAEEMLLPWPQLSERIRDLTDWVEQITIGSGQAQRRYEAAISRINDSQGRMAGRVMIVRDLGNESIRRIRPARTVGTVPVDSFESKTSDSAEQTGIYRFPFIRWIVDYFVAPIQHDLPVPPNISPVWYRVRERSFTIILRIGALVGTVAYVFTLPILREESRFTFTNFIFGVVLVVLWVLGFARQYSFRSRANVFLLLIYIMALNETVSYGFSVECFLFFTSFVIIATLLTGRSGVRVSSGASFLTLGIFVWLIGSGSFIPFNVQAGPVMPPTLTVGLTNVFVFLATSLAMANATVVLMENLNSAWQKETQALNLLQQERDLLEQRVEERTQDLSETETKFRTLVEQLPAVLYRDDANDLGVNNYFSPQVEKMFGYPMSNWEQDSMHWQGILHPDDREHAIATITETIATGHSTSEYRIFDIDGRVVWVRDEALLVRDARGNPQFVQGIMQDITEIKQAEEQIRKLSRAVEQSGNSIVITDTKGDIEYVNPKFEEVTGYSFEEVKGQNPRILKAGRQRPEFYVKLWKTITSGQVWHGVFNNKRKDGSLYWETATIAPVLDQNGRITNYVAIKEDITARREAEEQLRKLSQAVEQSANTVIIMDREGNIEYVNPTFTAITGYSPAEAIGNPPRKLMNPGTGDFREAEWWKTVTNGKIWHGEFQNHRKDGTAFWESASIAPVLDVDGMVTNFIEIKQDVTEQKLLQEQLQKKNEYLSVLHQITLDMLNRRDLDDLLQVIVDRSAILLDAPFSELMLEEDGFLVVKAFTTNQPSLKGDQVARGQAKLSWQAFDTHEPVVLDDYATWEFRREIYDSQTLHATADFPVMGGDRCLGVLALGRNTPG
ncbi:MAG: PAS domain S-box protein [Anaerolineales bacterium]|nr:PAS domain S-box protein [Anaerolineales bacterium]